MLVICSSRFVDLFYARLVGTFKSCVEMVEVDEMVKCKYPSVFKHLASGREGGVVCGVEGRSVICVSSVLIPLVSHGRNPRKLTHHHVSSSPTLNNAAITGVYEQLAPFQTQDNHKYVSSAFRSHVVMYMKPVIPLRALSIC